MFYESTQATQVSMGDKILVVMIRFNQGHKEAQGMGEQISLTLENAFREGLLIKKHSHFYVFKKKLLYTHILNTYLFSEHTLKLGLHRLISRTFSLKINKFPSSQNHSKVTT